jgi:hypothetical protein
MIGENPAGRSGAARAANRAEARTANRAEAGCRQPIDHYSFSLQCGCNALYHGTKVMPGDATSAWAAFYVTLITINVTQF